MNKCRKIAPVTNRLIELNDALKLAVEGAEGNAEKFALLLTAPLSGWMMQGMLEEEVSLEAIRLLHQLHPNVSV